MKHFLKVFATIIFMCLICGSAYSAEIESSDNVFTDEEKSWLAQAMIAFEVGLGDMVKAIYDADDDGIVDEAAVISSQGGMATIDDAPSDGTEYLRKNGAWANPSGSIDWTAQNQGTIDPTNYVDNDTIYGASDFDIKDLTDSTSLRSTWSGKQDALGFTPVNTADTTATPTANKIPIADANGKLDGWVTAPAIQDRHYMVIIPNPNGQYAKSHYIPLQLTTDEAITINQIEVQCENDPTTELDWAMYYADDYLTMANPVLVRSMDTVNGALNVTTGWGDNTIPSGKCPYIQFDLEPGADTPQTAVEITFETTTP